MCIRDRLCTKCVLCHVLLGFIVDKHFSNCFGEKNGSDTTVCFRAFQNLNRGAAGDVYKRQEIPMMYMYGIMPVCGIICAICVVIKIITLYKADISYFAPKNQALSLDDA